MKFLYKKKFCVKNLLHFNIDFIFQNFPHCFSVIYQIINVWVDNYIWAKLEMFMSINWPVNFPHLRQWQLKHWYVYYPMWLKYKFVIGDNGNLAAEQVNLPIMYSGILQLFPKMINLLFVNVVVYVYCCTVSFNRRLFVRFHTYVFPSLCLRY